METQSKVDQAAIEPKRVPIPRWAVRSAWLLHRALCTLSGGRRGLRKPTRDRWGMLRLTTVGRRSGKERRAILAYLEDGPNLVLMSMNGWADPDPAWFLNLKANPEVTIDLPDGRRKVRARVADADERGRLWAMWHGPWDEDLDAYAANLTHETPLVILEPHPGTAG